MADLDIVGSVGVDVVPLTPNFHNRLKAAVLPSADRIGRDVGERMGDAISRHLVISIPDAVNRGGNAAQRAGARQGDDVGGAFANSLRRKLTAAFKAMPKLDIRLGDTGVDAELARLRAKLEQLAGKRIGVDVDAMAARAEVQRIEEELKRLGAQHPNIAVRADTAAARAALAEIRAEIDAVDAKDVNVRVDIDTGRAQAALMGLAIQMGITAAIPLGPVIAAGLGAVVSMAAAAGAGIGAMALVAIPAVSGVVKVVQAQKAAQDEATKSTDNGAKAAVQASQRALQMAGAQATLSSAHRSAARSIAQASQQVETAERGVAQAVQRAADQRRQAADAVARAERSLSDAQRTARQAEQDLTQARADAARQLKALNDQLIDGALDQREATLRVQQAQLDLNATLADPMATDLQKEAAQLAFDQAQQAAKEQKQSYAELQKSAAAQKKAGVEGSDAVKTATQRLADAQRDVLDQTKAVADAQKAAARAQVDAAQTVADAQRSLASAVANAADTQVSAAESIASAERGVQSARLSGIDTTSKAISKTDEYQKALAKLTAPQRALFDAIAGPRGLKTAFDQWQKSLQPQVLPLFTRGVDSAKASLPGLTPLVLGAAAGVKTLYDKASAELKTPFWKGFKADLKDSVQPAVEGFGVAFGNVIKGIAGIIDAFFPHMDGIAQRSDRITARFAKWGTSLKGSPQFEKFLAYVKETAPGLADFIGRVLSSALDLSKAIAPLSQTMFEVLGPLLDGIAWIATNCPEAIQALWLMWAATRAVTLATAAFGVIMVAYRAGVVLATLITQGWTAAIVASNLAFEMNPVVAIITIIIAALVLLAAGIMYAWNHWAWFRTAVIAVWDAIKFAAMFVWDNVLKPVFSAIWTAMKAIGDVAMWLWNNALKPAFKFIGEAAQFLFTLVVTLFLLPAYLAFKALGKIGAWLWEKAIGPAFRAIGDAAKWLWDKILKPVFGWIGDKAKWVWEKGIKPAFGEAKKEFDALGKVAKWLWDKAIKPVFGWIGDKAKWLWDKAIKPPFERIKQGVDLVAEAFKKSKDDIKKHWDKLQEITKKPVRFVIDHVYNNGIVPLWNQVAKVTGADKLKPMSLKGFHTGGIMSGYSPGRDDRVIAVGGGEAVMRPEWTRAVGADRINAWNAAARSGGISGVHRAISSGMPAFADGGIVGWMKDKASDAGKFLGGAFDYLNPGKIFQSAKGVFTDAMAPILTNPWAKSVAQMPLTMLTDMKNAVTGLFSFGGGGANVAAGLSWAKTQAGKPYQWGGNGNPSWDCSGLMSAIESVIRGEKPHRRWATGAFSGSRAPSGWVRNLNAPFQIGVTNAGVGHTAGTLAGVNVESRGGDGVLVGSRARGAHSAMFRDVYGFKPSIGGGSGGSTGAAQTAARQMLGEFGWGDSQWNPLKKLWQGESGWRWNAKNPSSGAYGIPQALPANKMAAAGADWSSNPATQIKWGLGYIKNRPDYGSPAAAYSKWLSRSPHWYDDGGYLPEGLSLVANGTGKPEPVFTGSQWDTLRASAGRGGGTATVHADVRVYVGDREITDIVRTEVTAREESTASAINTGRWV
jgi:hypothetical protein